jgi:hypothetical protein
MVEVRCVPKNGVVVFDELSIWVACSTYRQILSPPCEMALAMCSSLLDFATRRCTYSEVQRRSNRVEYGEYQL